MKLWPKLCVLACAAVLPQTATALASCSTSATTVPFGSYNPFAIGSIDRSGTVTVSCSLGGLISLLVSYTIKLSPGLYGTYATRKLAAGSNRLNYNLYTSAAYSTVWGNGSSGTGTVSDGYLLGLTTTHRNYTVYGRLPALQNLPSGAYSDTITITVEY